MTYGQKGRMEPMERAKPVNGPSLGERVRRYILYAVFVITCAILLYILVWFGTQLGLQG